jgi:hypothetical protein
MAKDEEMEMEEVEEEEEAPKEEPTPEPELEPEPKNDKRIIKENLGIGYKIVVYADGTHEKIYD